MVALCLYDGMLTYVEVNHGALLAELTTSSSERARCNMYSAVCAALGSLSSFGAHMAWNPADVTGFRTFCVAAGAVALVVFEVSYRLLQSSRRPHSPRPPPAAVPNTTSCEISCPPPQRNSAATLRSPSNAASSGVAASPSSTLKAAHSGRWSRLSASFHQYSTFLKQLLGHRNFRIYAIVLAIQVFDCTFEKNFFSTWIDGFSRAEWPVNTESVIIGASFLLPHACTVVLTPVIQRVRDKAASACSTESGGVAE